MKIVLRQDVDNLGDRGQVMTVKPGYARNFLFPKGLALEATPGNMRQIELQKKVWAVREAHEADDARKLAAHIAGITLTVKKKVGEGGALYGSVTGQEIADLMAARGVSIDRRKIQPHDPIKTLGVHTVGIKVHRQVTAQVTVQVEAEAAE
ncbi:MAG TPA: 50S ribosomal protein L9 [Candidatus Polarisedimenticolaceae bacterium]|nr:50S ribosomal protein L9 [Candidatus Polarisedimenticolaceae bacterium]